ncbi:MAG: protein-L-isoaspartate(D-aspartate) O-methyltransferase, partial [Planctomycetaceae bacterium]|nr:protein-L-isoaspartate(D-aspartate) O-methyltransferase [Planctomycetaceae bacterium]
MLTFLPLFAWLVSGLLACPRCTQAQDPFEAARLAMVAEAIEAEGITNSAVLAAMKKVPRHEFVASGFKRQAYLDSALPIGSQQTISPPYVVAYMTEVLDPQPQDKVLEIGTGSGYQAAVLSEIVAAVYTIEIVPALARSAAKRLKELEYKNVFPLEGDGYKGWPEHAPFDKIIVTCSPESIPQPLVDQLREGGRMIIPVGERYQQSFVLLQKQDGELKQERLISTLFVPMTGRSEDERRVQPDPEHPGIVNGSFELDENNDGRADGWH